MKKFKILGIIIILALALVACSGKEDSKEKPKDVNQEEQTGMTDKDKKHFEELLKDVGDTETDRVENEIELVSLADEWISELAQMTVEPEEIKNITINYLATAEPDEVIIFKEVFPKLNEYAIGLINGDSNTLGLLKGADRKLKENILDEVRWVEVYEIVLSEAQK
ncbi:hypothetical protein [Miniphocaeibacter massiliensis]|uniref:hypothetical protein n=1 Tax=Miniphocaeibacter massiliensis TaxID=2041841 RepID=UPI000C1B8E77|nr:hypothetical protein [Miniphocaeibacter massiliensis]